MNVKPIAGSCATTTDQTIQTEKASSSAGIEIQRLRRAIARPVVSQNVLVLGPPVLDQHRGMARRARARGSPASRAGRAASIELRAFGRAFHRRIEKCIQVSAIPDEHEEAEEAARPDARSRRAARRRRSEE